MDWPAVLLLPTDTEQIPSVLRLKKKPKESVLHPPDGTIQKHLKNWQKKTVIMQSLLMEMVFLLR